MNTCEFCNKNFQSIGNLVYHQKTAKFCLKIQGKSITVSLLCENCGRNFSRKKDFLNHGTACKEKLRVEIIDAEDKLRNLEQEKIKYQERINSLTEQNIILTEQNKKLQETIASLAEKAISKPTTTTMNNTDYSRKITNNLEIKMYPYSLTDKEISHYSFIMFCFKDVAVNKMDTKYDPDISTELCNIMEKYGSDKGNCKHNYTTLYYQLFNNLRIKKLNIFELGIGTNNPNLASSMGTSGKPGASLRGWAEFFGNASVYGADIDKDILFESDRICTYYCDQRSPQSINAMWKQMDGIQFDIMIDDGLHDFEANKCFFENSIHMLSGGGMYIIEDIRVDQYTKWRNQINEWGKIYKLRYEVLPNNRVRNDFDNILLLISKK